jgi:hypothetical protein
MTDDAGKDNASDYGQRAFLAGHAPTAPVAVAGHDGLA